MLFTEARSLGYLKVMLSADYWTQILFAGYSRQFSLWVTQHTCYSGSCNGYVTFRRYNAHVVHTTCNAHVICRTFDVLICMSIHHTCYLKVIKPTVIFRSCSAHVISRSCNPFLSAYHATHNPSHATHMLFAGYATHIQYYIFQGHVRNMLSALVAQTRHPQTTYNAHVVCLQVMCPGCGMWWGTSSLSRSGAPSWRGRGRGRRRRGRGTPGHTNRGRP